VPPPGGAPPPLAPAPGEPAELGAPLGCPACGADSLERFESALDRLARRALLTAPTPNGAEREQCPRPAERVADRFVLGDRLREQGERLLDVASGGGGETRAS